MRWFPPEDPTKHRLLKILVEKALNLALWLSGLWLAWTLAKRFLLG